MFYIKLIFKIGLISQECCSHDRSQLVHFKTPFQQTHVGRLLSLHLYFFHMFCFEELKLYVINSLSDSRVPLPQPLGKRNFQRCAFKGLILKGY